METSAGKQTASFGNNILDSVNGSGGGLGREWTRASALLSCYRHETNPKRGDQNHPEQPPRSLARIFCAVVQRNRWLIAHFLLRPLDFGCACGRGAADLGNAAIRPIAARNRCAADWPSWKSAGPVWGASDAILTILSHSTPDRCHQKSGCCSVCLPFAFGACLNVRDSCQLGICTLFPAKSSPTVINCIFGYEVLSTVPDL